MSIVVPTFNRLSTLPITLQSLFDQTFGDFEILVVDDGSTDDTLIMLESNSDPRLRVIPRPHEGVGASRNAGASAAAGELLTFLDSDDTVERTWLDTMVGQIRQPGVDIALCGSTFVESDGTITVRLPPFRQLLHPDEVAPQFLAGTWMLRRNLFCACGGYMPGIQHGENTELALRLFTSCPQLVVRGVYLPLVRVTRRAHYADREAVVAGAMAVLDRYRSYRHVLPSTWASYNTLVGVELAKRRDWLPALKYLFAALRWDPAWRRFARVLAAALPPIGRRVWHAGSADE